MIKTFISYSHAEHQTLKEQASRLINDQKDFWDKSVKMGDIDDSLTDEAIRKKIRDEFLADTTVTVVICGKNAPHRKHIDWEIHSSMYNGSVNSKSGIVVIDTLGSSVRTHSDEVKGTYNCSWTSTTIAETRNKFSHLPDKILDNLVKAGVHITVLPWLDIQRNPSRLIKAIKYAHDNRGEQDYDLSQPMRSRNNDKFTIY